MPADMKPGPTVLLIVAHGSRRQASNDEVRQLGEQVARQCGVGIDMVQVAFLELAEPDIPQALQQCLGMGAAEIIVFPYFLAAGTHVANDIPEIIGRFRASHPDIAVRLTPHLGASSRLPRSILDMAAPADANA